MRTSLGAGAAGRRQRAEQRASSSRWTRAVHRVVSVTTADVHAKLSVLAMDRPGTGGKCPRPGVPQDQLRGMGAGLVALAAGHLMVNPSARPGGPVAVKVNSTHARPGAVRARDGVGAGRRNRSLAGRASRVWERLVESVRHGSVQDVGQVALRQVSGTQGVWTRSNNRSQNTPLVRARCAGSTAAEVVRRADVVAGGV